MRRERFVAIIPARWASTRFPGKPMAEIFGKTMIQRVYEGVAACQLLEDTIVATDSQVIYDHVKGFGGKVMITSSEHKSGTERCHEVACRLFEENFIGEDDVIINVQGDEPFVERSHFHALESLFEEPHVTIGTLRKKIEDIEQVSNPNIVKVVCDEGDRALYFSRAAIPHVRGKDATVTFWKHIGIYAYRFKTLRHIALLSATPLERVEMLEQLRWLEHGYTINVATTNVENIAVDTPEDLRKIIEGRFF